MLILPGIRVHFGGQLDVRLRLLFLLLVPLAGVGQRGLVLGVAVLRGRLVVGEARLELLQPGVKVARWQNLIPSFPWIAPGWRAGSAIQGKEGIKFCHLATLIPIPRTLMEPGPTP